MSTIDPGMSFSRPTAMIVCIPSEYSMPSALPAVLPPLTPAISPATPWLSRALAPVMNTSSGPIAANSSDRLLSTFRHLPPSTSTR
jgi:hypothetical protein